MSIDSVSFNYTIQNGQFLGVQKTFTIRISDPSVARWHAALIATMGGTNLLGNFIALYLYARSMKGSGAAFSEIGQRLSALETPLPNPAQALVEGEVEMSGERTVELTGLEEVTVEAEAAVIADGALDAAAAASILPGIGWVVAGGILATSALIAGGLAIYDIVNSGETPLVSVVFINGIPNSKFQFIEADWSTGMKLVGGDTKESMMLNKATSTMSDAGSLQYTWQTAGNQPNGTATLKFDLDSGPSCNAELVWSINPNTGKHECTLNHKSGDDLLSALCYKQPVEKGGKTHYVLLYLILPSNNGAARATFTIKQNIPLIFDNMWASDTGLFKFGLYFDNSNPDSTYHLVKGGFIIGNKSYILRDITLPIFFHSGVNHAIITLCVDDGGKPGSIIETFNATDLPPAEANVPPVILTSVSRPQLNAGSKYWIVADMADKKSSGFWSASNFVPNPLDSMRPAMRFAVGGNPV